MIKIVLQAITNDLNVFLKRRLNMKEDVVILSELMNLDGSVAVTSKNKLICSLLNIEQERNNLNIAPGNQTTRRNAPFYFNLYVLFSAYYTTAYGDGLDTLSLAIGYFQGKQVFTPTNTPGLDPSIDKLTLEIVNTEMKDLSNFWTALGSKHLPSIVFKIRMVPISAEVIQEEVTPIQIFDTQINIPTNRM